MKFVQLSIVLQTIARLGSGNVSGSSFYSTKLLPTQRFSKPGGDPLHQLYRRISPVGDPKVSIVPILDQWIEEGRSVNKDQLQRIIKELRYYKRYTHALQISMWMTDKRYFELKSRDVALRLDLLSKIHGIEQVEKYFNNVPQQLRVLEVYGALLNCYSNAKSVEKAEAVMQKMRDLGFAKTSLTYNAMLNLYYRTGNMEKLEGLVCEMEENGIPCDRFSLSIQLSSYAAVSDIERVEKIITKMESDSKVVLDWSNYGVAANAYTKAGHIDKALEMLKKSEGLVTKKRRSTAYNFLLTQYAAIGMKDEVLKLWELYKKKEKVYNKGYISIMASLSKLDDVETAEKIFEEWESQKLKYDIRIPNLLISAYSRKGLLERAETLIEKAVSKGGEPDAFTWYYLATGYLRTDQTAKAMEMMKKAITTSRPRWKPSCESLASCLEHLKQEGDLQKVEEFIILLLDNGIISPEVQEKLLNHTKSEKPYSNILDKLNGDSLVPNGNTTELLEPEEDSSDCISEEKC